jgi:hypothetical protein
MAKNGYGLVEDKGFLSFGGALEEGAWESVQIKKYDNEEMIAASPLASLPSAVFLKLQATWGIRALVKAMSVGNTVELDKEWDSAQRSFSSGVASEEDHKDAAHRAAAGRIRTALLDGAGTSQTQLDLDKEYDFGMKQLRLAEEKSLAADLKLTGLTSMLDRIQEATVALGEGIGRAPGKNRAPSRSLRIRDALQECSASFNSIHDWLVWAIDNTPSGPDRDKLEQMLSPFQALLDRYPATAAAAATAAGDVQGAPAPAAATKTTDGKDPSGTKTP